MCLDDALAFSIAIIKQPRCRVTSRGVSLFLISEARFQRTICTRKKTKTKKIKVCMEEGSGNISPSVAGAIKIWNLSMKLANNGFSDVFLQERNLRGFPRRTQYLFLCEIYEFMESNSALDAKRTVQSE